MAPPQKKKGFEGDARVVNPFPLRIGGISLKASSSYTPDATGVTRQSPANGCKYYPFYMAKGQHLPHFLQIIISLTSLLALHFIDHSI